MLRSHLKIAKRNIQRQPLPTALKLSCLTIGISATLLILLHLHFELTYDGYHSNGEHVYRVATNAIKTHERTIDVTWNTTPAPLGPAIEKDIPGVEAYARLFQFWGSDAVKFEYQGDVQEENNVYAADPSVFNIFSFDFITGNMSNALSGPDKIVLSESFAKRIFGNENPVGKIVKSSLPLAKPGVNNQFSFVVTGVYRDMPKNVHLPMDALISAQTDRALPDYYYNQFNVFTYLLLYPETDAQALASKFTGIYLKHLDPGRDPVLVSASHKLTRITDIHIESTGGFTYVYIFSAVGILILLISGISYVNLATAQASRRALEVGLRKVMGSPRMQLIYQFLGEAIILTLISTLLAIVIIMAGIRSVNEMLNLNLDITQLLDLKLILGIIAIILSLGVLGGSYPAFFLASLEPIKAIKNKITGKAPLRKTLVTVQLIVVIFVLICTGMIREQLWYLNSKDLGFDKERIINLSMDSQDNGFNQYQVFRNTLVQNTSIRAVGTSNFIPGTDDMGRRPIAIDGSPGQEQKFVYWGSFDYDFLPTMNIPIQSGRNFTPALPGDTAAIIVNETLVKAFRLKEPLGDKVRFGGKGNPRFFTIVGVVKDFHQSTLYTPIEPQVYLLSTGNKLFVKVANDIPSAINHIEQTWKNIFNNSPFAYHFIEDELEDGYKGEQVRGKIFFLLSFLTIFIAFLGLFGLASYMTTQRIKEIGIRKIHGATLKDSVFLITRDFVRLVIIAVIPAFVTAWYVVNQWLENFAFRVDINYVVFAFAFVFTLVLTFGTTGIHAWRAASAHPLKNLRHE